MRKVRWNVISRRAWGWTSGKEKQRRLFFNSIMSFPRIWLKLALADALAMQSPHLGRLAGFFFGQWRFPLFFSEFRDAFEVCKRVGARQRPRPAGVEVEPRQ